MDDEERPEDAAPSPMTLKLPIPGVGDLEIRFPHGLKREEYEMVVRRLELLRLRHAFGPRDDQAGGE